MNQNQMQPKPRTPEQPTGEGLWSSAFFGVPVLSCAVKSNQGQHCPEPPNRMVRIDGGEEIMLCSRCYENACAGAYGDVSVIPVREIDLTNSQFAERR
jgi:hypothetical protein